MDAKLGIEKLTNGNYPQWSFEAEMLLEREDLWKFVSEAKPNPVTAAWTSGDRKARATISLLVEKRQHPLIRDAKSAKETWDKLKAQHQKTTMCSRVALICQVCDKKLAEGGDLEAHIYDLEELFSRLQSAGKDLGEDIQVAILLRSLPMSYEHVRTALLILKDDELKMDFVKGKLLEYSNKLQEGDEFGESALKVNSMKKLICHNCGKRGHKKKDCYASQDFNLEKYSKPKDEPKKEKPYAFFLDDSCGLQKEWIVDSGASCHVCCDRSFFDTIKPKTGKSVFLANGKEAKVQGVGSGRIHSVDERGDRTAVTLSEVLFVPGLEVNLVSVSKLIHKGADVRFGKEGCRIMAGNDVAAVAVKRGGLYRVKLHGEQAQKKHSLARKMTFVGYCTDRKTLKLAVSRDEDFIEVAETTCRGNQQMYNGNDEEDAEDIVGDDPVESSNNDEEQQEDFESAAESSFDETLFGEDPGRAKPEGARRSTRSTKGVPPLRYTEVSGVADEPHNHDEAVGGLERDEWLVAMQEELNSLAKNQTWEMSTLPSDKAAKPLMMQRDLNHQDKPPVRRSVRGTHRGSLDW